MLWINDIEKQRSVALQLTTSDLCSKHRSCTLSKIKMKIECEVEDVECFFNQVLNQSES